MATTNKQFSNQKVLRGLEALRADQDVIREELVDVSVIYASPAANAFPAATVRVVQEYTISSEDADDLLRNA